jgi:hypothetical protein
MKGHPMPQRTYDVLAKSPTEHGTFHRYLCRVSCTNQSDIRAMIRETFPDTVGLEIVLWEVDPLHRGLRKWSHQL